MELPLNYSYVSVVVILPDGVDVSTDLHVKPSKVKSGPTKMTEVQLGPTQYSFLGWGLPNGVDLHVEPSKVKCSFSSDHKMPFFFCLFTMISFFFHFAGDSCH